uniref:peptidyl-tRNA hydrolase n=1 Tax=Geospiza parvula TaxID=87175 RepID=A0A8U8B0V4_GEOPR
MAAVLVQYVVLRGDLARPPLSWPLGAVVAQGCHAALAAVHGYREHPDTGAYLEQGDAMTTVVLEVMAAPRGMMGNNFLKKFGIFPHGIRNNSLTKFGIFAH